MLQTDAGNNEPRETNLEIAPTHLSPFMSNQI